MRTCLHKQLSLYFNLGLWAYFFNHILTFNHYFPILYITKQIQTPLSLHKLVLFYAMAPSPVLDTSIVQASVSVKIFLIIFLTLWFQMSQSPIISVEKTKVGGNQASHCWHQNFMLTIHISQAAKELLSKHLVVINALVDNIMTEQLGLIGENKISPALKEAFEVFLPASCFLSPQAMFDHWYSNPGHTTSINTTNHALHRNQEDAQLAGCQVGTISQC